MAEAGFPLLSPADKTPIVARVQSTLVECAGDGHRPPRTRQFLGSMPVTLSRRHLSMVRANDYLLLEKSDGVRYMLFATEQLVVLVDRKLDVYAVTPYPVLIMPDGTPQAGTLLDGELVRNQRTEQWEYLVYDAVSIAGDSSIGRLDLRTRVDAVERYVCYPRSLHPAASGCLRIRRKDFYEKHQLPLLFERIAKKRRRQQPQRRQERGDAGGESEADGGGGGDAEYVYEHLRYDGVLCNCNDGVVLTPVHVPYPLRTCQALLKWKYPSHNTVDFVLWLESISTSSSTSSSAVAGGHAPNHEAVHAYLGYKGDNGIVRYREVFFPTKLKRAWYAEYARWHECIIECTYDRVAGEWRFLRQRDDKESPNYSSVVMDCLEAIAESVSREEMVDRVTGGGAARKRKGAGDDGVHRDDGTAAAEEEEEEALLFDERDADYVRVTPISRHAPPTRAAIPLP